MKKEIERLRNIEEANRKLKEVQYQAALADQRKDAVEQYTRLTNLRSFNMAETEKWETAETSEDKVIAIIHDKLELRHVKSEDIKLLTGWANEIRKSREPLLFGLCREK